MQRSQGPGMTQLLTHAVILTNQIECNSGMYQGHLTYELLPGVTFMAVPAWQKSETLNSTCIFSTIF